MAKAHQVAHCHNCRGKSKRWAKRLRNRAQRRTSCALVPDRCTQGWAD